MNKIILVLLIAIAPFLNTSVAHAMGSSPPAVNIPAPVLPPPPPSLTVKCGDVITANAKIANDLNCPNVTGYALLIEGDNITVDGNNHSISAPNAAAGLFISGNTDNVSNFKINGVSGGYGILAYDSPNAIIANNDVSNNLIGLMLYAGSKVVSGVAMTSNKAKNSVLFGVRTSQDSPGSIVSPNISSNDFSGSGSYAMYISASSFSLDGSANANTLTGSIDGIYLYGGNFTISNLDLSAQTIQKTQIFAYSTSSLILNNVNLSSSLQAQSSQERIGLEMYRVANFSITGLTVKNDDIGVRLETDSKVSSAGTIQSSAFGGQTIAGMIISSYDSTAFGTVNNTNNTFQESLPVQSILVGSGTVVSLISTLPAPPVPTPGPAGNQKGSKLNNL